MDLKHLPSIIELELESKSYEELPKVIHHPVHPNHPLYLHDESSAVFCSLCRLFLKKSSYRCHEDECIFTIHVECISMMLSIKHEDHHHLLTLIERCNKKRSCESCRYVSDYFYARCVPCDINYHLQCNRKGLPDTTIYEFHNHPLFLTYNTDKEKVCDVCEKQIHPDNGFPVDEGREWSMYHCEKCDYSCHVRCVIYEIKRDNREKLDHTCHEHVLFLCVDEDSKDEASCSVCGNFVSADDTTFTYGCSPCSFYIHKSCIDKLPVREIAHEFHPDHPLILHWKKDGFSCNACCMKISGFTYRCVECEFDLGLDCTLKHPSIRDKHHPHLLTYFDNTYQNQECKYKCGFYSPNAVFLRCVQCNLSAHLLCSPLPREIKFEGHLHSLALEDYHIEDDFGEYYCDHCEGPRDPKECAYHCNDKGCRLRGRV